jgi:Predicted exporters of the RND superfamily
MSVPYFGNSSIFYIGYLIVSSVQLGATVDYAILLGERYVENRKTLPKVTAAKKTLSDTAVSILTSAGILSVAGALLGKMSTHGVISQLGTLIGRGVLLSLILILFVLPTLLVLLDGLLLKTSYKLDFYKGAKKNVEQKVM